MSQGNRTQRARLTAAFATLAAGDPRRDPPRPFARIAIDSAVQIEAKIEERKREPTPAAMARAAARRAKRGQSDNNSGVSARTGPPTQRGPIGLSAKPGTAFTDSRGTNYVRLEQKQNPNRQRALKKGKRFQIVRVRAQAAGEAIGSTV